MAINNSLPESGLVRAKQLFGDAKNGVPPILPICKASWWNGVKSGKYPAPIKLGPRTTCWRAEDIRRIAERGLEAA